MKTKSAFAFQDFDEKKILSRSFFKDFRLPDGDDDTALEYFAAEDFANSADAEKKLEQLRRLYDRVTDFRRMVNRHVARLRKFWMATDDERAAALLRKYSWYNEVLEMFQLKFGGYFVNGEDRLDDLYRKEFGSRLKAAREAAGMTPKDVARKLSLTVAGYQFYELGKRAPSIPTIIKLSKMFNCPPGSFFP